MKVTCKYFIYENLKHLKRDLKVQDEVGQLSVEIFSLDS